MILYLDTSSFVKLFVEEAASEEVRGLVERAAWVATSVVAYAEARSAFARQSREGSLTETGHRWIKHELDGLWSQFLVIRITEEIRTLAGDLAELHALRGFDSIHLASYAELVKASPNRETYFSCFDHRLQEAALRLRHEETRIP